MVIEDVADEHREPLDLVDLMGPIDPVAIDSLAVQRCQQIEPQQDAARIVQSRHARRDDGVSIPDSRRDFTLHRGQLVERHEDLGPGRKLDVWTDVLVHERVDAICDRAATVAAVVANQVDGPGVDPEGDHVRASTGSPEPAW